MSASVLSATNLTLLDWAKRLDPDGKVAAIAELLAQQNELLVDMPFVEGNLPTGHRSVVRTGLPDVYWRLLNAGVQPSKSETAQVDEGCGMLTAWSRVDKDLAELNGNVAAFRASEGIPFLEAMNQEMIQTSFYGNSSTAPEEFNGLSIRYSSLSAANAANIISAGGGGADNSSVWLVGWSPQTVFGIFPKGSKAGLTHSDKGLQIVENAGGVTGALMEAYTENWQWKTGIALKDWRYAVRIPNIDISNLVAKSSAADLIELMIKAIHRIPNIKMCKPAFYMNRSCMQMLDIQRRDDVMSGGQLSYSQVDGVQQYTFRGIPVRLCDQLTQSETVVS